MYARIFLVLSKLLTAAASICLFATLALAQATAQTPPVTVTTGSKQTFHMPSDGKYALWVGNGLPNEAPAGISFSSGSDQSIDSAELKKGSTLFFWDEMTNNVAVLDIKSLPLRSNSNIDLADFKFIGSLKVRVEHSGKPVSVAQVRLNDGKREINAIIDPTSDGYAPFFGVNPGSVKVTTTYKVGSTSKTVSQSFEVKLNHDQQQPVLGVVITDDVATSTEISTGGTEKSDSKSKSDTTTPTEKSAKPEAKESPASVVGKIVVYLVCLAAGIAVIFYLMQYGKNNTGVIQGGLTKLGVPVPNPDPAGPSIDPHDPAAFAPKQPDPPAKIMLPDAAPDPIPHAPMQVAPPTGIPSLATLDGRSFTLIEGENLVGRDGTLPIGLPTESSVSRKHAAVVKSGASVLVRDLGSTNGTFVNGVKITTDTPLNPGDHVQFGQVAMTYHN